MIQAMKATIAANIMKIFQLSKFAAYWSSSTTDMLKVKAIAKKTPITKKMMAAARFTNLITSKCFISN